MHEATVAPTLPDDGPPLRSPASYHQLARTLEQRSGVGPATRVTVVSTYTASFLKPFLQVELARLGVTSEIYFAGFGQLESQLLDAQSALFAFAPDIVIIASRIEDAIPDAVLRVRKLDGSDLEQVLNDSIERISALVSCTLAIRTCRVLVANFAMPALSTLGIGDAGLESSRTAAFARANERLRALLATFPGAHVWDYAGLVAAHGALGWADPRLWFVARIPVAAPHHGALAQHLARTIRAALFPPAKVLVLDLDNTIWGGVIGDDGVGGIQLGDEWPGSGFKALQRRILGLRDRGILLAIASKNDLSVVEDAFRAHPEMLLSWSDMAAARVSWAPKSQGIREMAEELSLGLDAFVLLDDNPLERAEVLSAIPQMRVVNVEAWGSLERALAECPWFDQLSTSSEDLKRSELYAHERQRRDLSTQYASVSDFLVSLQMTGDAGRVTDVDRSRVAQLFAKTNQFNLTGRRPSESELAQWSELPEDHCVARIRIRDRFGDQGLVAAAVMHRERTRARIDTFVMSCRVMNRQVEHALLAQLGDVAREWNCDAIEAEFIRSARNEGAADFLPQAGFQIMNDGAGVAGRLGMSLDSDVLAWPNCINRKRS